MNTPHLINAIMYSLPHVLNSSLGDPPRTADAAPPPLPEQHIASLGASHCQRRPQVLPRPLQILAGQPDLLRLPLGRLLQIAYLGRVTDALLLHFLLQLLPPTHLDIGGIMTLLDRCLLLPDLALEALVRLRQVYYFIPQHIRRYNDK